MSLQLPFPYPLGSSPDISPTIGSCSQSPLHCSVNSLHGGLIPSTGMFLNYVGIHFMQISFLAIESAYSSSKMSCIVTCHVRK